MKEQPSVSTVKMPHVISLSERSTLSASGVQDVDSFDETTVIVYTELGELTVKGTGLHIRHLNVETGDLTLEGHVESLTYTQVHSRAGGFFGKLFR